MSLQGSLEKRDDHFILRMDSTAQEEPNHPILHSAASEQTVKTISKLRSAAIMKNVFFSFLKKKKKKKAFRGDGREEAQSPAACDAPAGAVLT